MYLFLSLFVHVILQRFNAVVYRLHPTASLLAGALLAAAFRWWFHPSLGRCPPSLRWRTVLRGQRRRHRLRTARPPSTRPPSTVRRTFPALSRCCCAQNSRIPTRGLRLVWPARTTRLWATCANWPPGYSTRLSSGLEISRSSPNCRSPIRWRYCGSFGASCSCSTRVKARCRCT